MALISFFSPKSMTHKQYDEAMRQLEAAGNAAPEGRIAHICYGKSPKLKIATMWRSPEDFQQMAPALLPILKGVGLEFGKPEIYEVHDIQLEK